MLHVPRFQEKQILKKMADLPVERCTEVPPFTYFGVDMFRPYLIKERWSTVKEIQNIIYMFYLSCHIYGSYKCFGH